jgi:hypothetical protein
MDLSGIAQNDHVESLSHDSCIAVNAGDGLNDRRQSEAWSAGLPEGSFFGRWVWDSEQTVEPPGVQGVGISPLRRSISQFE